MSDIKIPLNPDWMPEPPKREDVERLAREHSPWEGPCCTCGRTHRVEIGEGQKGIRDAVVSVGRWMPTTIIGFLGFNCGDCSARFALAGSDKPKQGNDDGQKR